MAAHKTSIALVLFLICAALGRPDAITPQRIVSIVPSVTEMLFAMGAGPRVVGVGNFDRYPPEALTRPKVGGLIDPDVERVISLKPDLMVVYGTQTDLRAQMDRAGIPIFLYQHAGLADITSTIRDLGARIGNVKESTTSRIGLRRTSPTSNGASPDVHALERCSSSGATQKRCAASTQAEVSGFFTTCSRRPEARTCSPTSSARVFRRRASSL